MKTFIVACLLLTLSTLITACDDDEKKEPEPYGCISAKSKISGNYIMMRCATKKEFEAEGDTTNGGTPNWDNYEDHQWNLCEQCK